MSDEQSTEQRLVLLERFAEAVTSRQNDEDQLHEGVNRLSDETNALNAILQKIDDQQKLLSVIAKRTEIVEETAVSRDELISAHDQQEKIALDFRKRTLNRIYFTGLIIAVTLFAGVVTFLEVQSRSNEARYRICVDRNEESDILYDILVGLTKNVPPEAENTDNVKLIRQGIARLESKIVDCEALR